MKKNNFKKEWRLLEKCEKGSHTGISAKQRFIELLSILPQLPEPEDILDVGGNFATAAWFKLKFPNSKVTILNKSKKELASYPNTILANAEYFRIKKRYDLIFCGETIEHLYNPDGLLASCLLALKPGGYLITTTPNLSCLPNRLFLLLGWSLANYSPSLRYTTGNPFLRHRLDGFGFSGDHKSLFTWRALRELLEKYDFKIIHHRGFSYTQEEKIQIIGQKYVKQPMHKLRNFVNSLLPHHLREGMLVVCQAPDKIDRKAVLKAILKKDLWSFS